MTSSKKNKIIIGLVGKIAAGKGTAAEYLQRKYDAHIYRFSTMLRDVLNRLHIPITRESMQLLSTILRKNFGEDLLAKVIASDVDNDPHKLIVVDGIRRLADIKYLTQIDGFILVKIKADPKVRYERILKRNENEDDNKKTFEEFLADEKKEADAEIPKVMEKAKLSLDNNKDFDYLYKQIDEIIESLN